jgi:hypothetical protein
MPNNNEKNRQPFEQDTEEAFRLPKPTPELSQDEVDANEKRADSAIDDLEIEVDEEELKAESESPGRKY